MGRVMALTMKILREFGPVCQEEEEGEMTGSKLCRFQEQGACRCTVPHSGFIDLELPTCPL